SWLNTASSAASVPSTSAASIQSAGTPSSRWSRVRSLTVRISLISRAKRTSINSDRCLICCCVNVTILPPVRRNRIKWRAWSHRTVFDSDQRISTLTIKAAAPLTCINSWPIRRDEPLSRHVPQFPRPRARCTSSLQVQRDGQPSHAGADQRRRVHQHHYPRHADGGRGPRTDEPALQQVRRTCAYDR